MGTHPSQSHIPARHQFEDPHNGLSLSGLTDTSCKVSTFTPSIDIARGPFETRVILLTQPLARFSHTKFELDPL